MLLNTDRVLFIINDEIIEGASRFHKYGFLLFKEMEKLCPGFYQYWETYHFGPYSPELDKDIQICIERKLLSKLTIEGVDCYSLTIQGKVMMRDRFGWNDEIVKYVQELQSMSVYGLFKKVWDGYPEYVGNGLKK